MTDQTSTLGNTVQIDKASKKKSIQRIAIHSISLSAVLSFAFLMIFLLFWGQKLLTTHLVEASTLNSKAMLVGLEALMRKGGNSDELQKLVDEMNGHFINMKVALDTKDFEALSQIEVEQQQDQMIIKVPVLFEQKCLQCHVDGKVGQQHALIIHQHPISEVLFSLTEVFALLVIFTMTSFLLMFILTFLYLRFWVIEPLKDLSHFIDQINSHDELDIIHKSSNIAEVENIRHAFNKLGKALNHSYVQSVYASETDELTGVGNRRQMNEVLELRLQRAKQTNSIFSLFMFDLNGFKGINDEYGHKAGDEALKLFSNVLKKVLRHEDFIFRLGGDEFVLFLNDVRKENIDVIKNRIRKLLQENPLQLNDTEIILSSSIGSACYPDDEVLSLEQLIEKADDDMFKDKGKHYENNPDARRQK